MNTSLVITWQSFTATYVFRSSSASSCVLLLYTSLSPPFPTFSVATCSIAESENSVFKDSISAFLYFCRSLHVIPPLIANSRVIGASGNTSMDCRAFSLRTDVTRLLGDTKFIFDSASDYIASPADRYFEREQRAENLRGGNPEDGRLGMAEGNGLELLEGGEFDGEQGNDHVVKVEDRGGEIHARVEWLASDDPEDQIETVF